MFEWLESETEEHSQQFWLLVIVAQVVLILTIWLGFVKFAGLGIQSMTEWKVFPYICSMEVTAYTAGIESTGKHELHPEFGITASTHRIAVGGGERLLAAPPEIAFGTRMFVPGYGVGVVKDRGEAIQGDCLDVYFDDLERARAWGRQRLTVFVFP